MHRLMAILVSLALGAAAVQAAPSKGLDFPIAEGNGMQGRPAMTYDPNGDRFFLTWLDYRNKGTSGLDIYGRIVDSRGNPVTPEFPVTRSLQSQSFPAVAFDTVNNRFLVTWSDWRDAADIDSDVYGRLFNADGSPYGDEFQIAALRGVSQKFASLAFDPVRQRFLVLWVDNRNHYVDKIYGAFVGADGHAQGDGFPVAMVGEYQDSPSVLFDQRKDQFLVVWRNIRNVTPERFEKAVIGRFVTGDGNPRGAAFQIALEEHGCTPLSLKAASFSPGEDFYFVAWSSGRNYNEVMASTGGYGDRQRGLDVYGAFIGVDDGGMRKEPFMIASEIDYQEMPSVEYDPNSDRFLVVWYDLRRPPTNKNTDIYARYVTPKGTMTDEFLVSDEMASGSRQYPTVGFSPRSNAFLILWEDGRNGGGEKTRIFGAVR